MAESAAGPAGRIFISYRRDDTAYAAGWLYDRLATRYSGGQVFKDVDSIDLGDDFVQVITAAVGSCDVLLALIGEQWLTRTDEQGQRRLDDPEDFVRLEIEAALARAVRVIPILIDGARMPRADDLPESLVSLERRQALELSPSRFEYDTGRLLKVLDNVLADVRAAQDGDAATSAPAATQDGKSTGRNGVLPDAGTARGASPEEAANRPLRASASASSTAGTDNEDRPRKHAVERSRTLRRVLMIAVPLAVVLVAFVIIQVILDAARSPEGGGGQSSATGELNEKAPWRLVIRNELGGSIACTITLVNSDTKETWSNPHPVYDEALFLIPQGGRFRWPVEPGCTVVSRPGPGNFDYPGVVDGVGTSEAFKPPALVSVTLKDFRGNYRCDLQLRDVATGTIVDIGALTAQQKTVTLQPHGRPLVYLVNDACAVHVEPG